MRRIFSDCAGMLETRLMRGVYTTEDSVRYTMFASMLVNDIDHDAVILEFPHPDIQRTNQVRGNQRLDTWMPEVHGSCVVIEFKYDRELPGGKNLNKTEKAGDVFEDLRRLQLLTDHALCYFVYVATHAMDAYFKNPANGHVGLYELPPGESVKIGKDFFSTRPPSFIDRIRGDFEANVMSVLRRRIADDHHLRIYKVEPI